MTNVTGTAASFTAGTANRGNGGAGYAESGGGGAGGKGVVIISYTTGSFEKGAFLPFL